MFFFFQDPGLDPLQTPEMQAFIAGIEATRGSYPSMTIGMLGTFFASACAQQRELLGGADLKRLSQDLGVPYSTIARHSDILSSGTARQSGLNLVEKRSIPGQNKQKSMFLTVEGTNLLKSISEAISSELTATRKIADNVQ